MPAQTYATHRHPPRMTGVGFMFLVIAIVGFFFSSRPLGRSAIVLGFAGAIFMLLLISRTYTTALQDRIIKLEMRVRCASLLTPQQQATIARLGKAQLIALRFASDGELGTLVERADGEQLTADQIKRAITNWVADMDRT
jgi:hypothetical protein